MKRLILLATMVAVLASCEKHEIRNEVLTEIGFESKVGKQTKAIIDGTSFTNNHFGVLAYGHYDNVVTKVMDNIEITNKGANGASKWVATSGSYYWPNQAETYMNFYAYSPKLYASNGQSANADYHNQMNGTITASNDTDPNGIQITGYVHRNMYVDFMTAIPVTNAKFKDKNGDGTEDNLESVPTVFKHQMAQIVFTIKLNNAYSGITFTLINITLNDLYDRGKVVNGQMLVADNATADKDFQIYPALVKTEPDGAPNLSTAENNKQLSTTEYYTQAVTMIPQPIFKTATEGQNDAVSRTFTVEYTISGNGVATETVTKTIALANTNTSWVANKKYIYNLTIGMNEIIFNPSVIEWDDMDGDGLNNPEDDPAENEGSENVTIPVV